MLLWKPQYVGRLHHHLYRAKRPDSSPFPRGGYDYGPDVVGFTPARPAQQLESHSLQRSLDTEHHRGADLSAFCLQLSASRPPGWVPPRLFPTPHHPTPRIGPYHCTWCSYIGIGAFSFWQPWYPSFSVLVSYFFLQVYCLPKMTSLRCGGGSACCRCRQSADRRRRLARQGRQ